MTTLADTAVDLARIQFATTALYHFLFVPLTLGLAPLVAYFEIYHLAPGQGGLARFEYEYTVRSMRDRRIWIQRALAPRQTPAPIIATREEQQAGDLRRQYLSVPVQALPPGRYTLGVKVRDLVSGAEARRETEFERAGAFASANDRRAPGTP